MDAFAVARLVIGAGFLAVAASLDVRTRRVRDPLWVALGVVSLAILAVELAWEGSTAPDWLLMGSASVLFFAVFYGNPILDEEGVHLRPVRILLLAAAGVAFLAGVFLPNDVPLLAPVAGVTSLPQVPLAALASMPVMMIVYQGFFQLGFLRGGADTKAMMALTLLVPYYPDLAPFPILSTSPNVAKVMQVLFPFSLMVLVDAALLFLAVPVAYLVVNAVRGDLEFPQALFGTKASLDRLPPHVWLMERIDRHGERVAVLFPPRRKDESEEIAKLSAAGAKRVWVQPKVPFLVPLFAGFLLALFAGNVLLGFLSAILPHP